MPRLIAFLRAINVGGHNVTMEKLRGLFVDVGFKEVETFIASGNVIFVSRIEDSRVLERKIERHLLQSLGYEVKTFIRTIPEVAAVAGHKPFAAAELKSAAALNVAFLADPISVAAGKSVMVFKTEADDFHVHGREVYWLCKTKQSDSKFSNTRFEKILNTRATWRNVNTVVRLVARFSKE